jgi:hypothetical protein
MFPKQVGDLPYSHSRAGSVRVHAKIGWGAALL